MTVTTSTRKSSRGAEGLLSGNRRAAIGPQRPRTRSLGLVAAAALLVIGCGLVVAAWGLSAGDRVSVLSVGVAVPKGQPIEREDLVSVSVAGVEDAIAVGDIEDVVGRVAAVDLVAGQVLTSGMVTTTAVPGAGESVIGLALDPTRVPGAGLQPGDRVDVIAVPGQDTGGKDAAAGLDSPELLAGGAEVYEVGGETVAGSLVLVTLIVDAGDASRVAAYSTQNRVAVVETALGVEAGE